MSKARILLVTHYFESHGGGVEVVASKIASRLGERGFGVDWLASNTDRPPELTGVTCHPMEAMNLTERKLGIPYPIWSISARRKLKQMVRDCDLVHIHDSLYFANALAARQARKLGKPYVVTQHIGFVPYKNPLFRTILTVANKTLALGVLKGAAARIFISENALNYFVNLGLDRSKCEFVPNGVESDLYRPDDSANASSIGLDPQRPVCLFVGRFVEKKGLPIIKRLAEATPNVQWVLAGWGPIEPNSWGLPNVTVFNDRKGPTLVPLYQLSDLLVLPSVGEGFPLVVQEAMACGTLSIVSTETASAYTDARSVMYSCDVPDDRGWIKLISDLLKDRDALKTRKSELAEFARAHWSWDGCVDQYERIFADAMESN